MKKELKILGTLFLMITSTFGFSQGEIHGKVFEKESNLPAIGATVFVEVGGNKVGTVTDIDGRYKLKPLNAGVYNLSIKLMGMNPVVMSEVVVNKDKITWIKDVSLSANIELNVLIIEELRYKDSERLIKVEDPTAMTMTSAEIEKSPLLREPVDLIATMPGVTKKGGQLYFRGARSDAILYFIDGVKNRGNGLGIPSSAIGEITVYTGGIPAKYGDVTGGIVVVETKSYFDLYNANK